MNQLANINLPDGTVWSNRWAYSPVRQSNARTTDGGFTWQVQQIHGGMPIVLEWLEGRAFLSFDEMDTLRQMAATPGQTYSLNWENVLYVVLFNHAQPPVFEFTPIYGFSNSPENDLFFGKLNLITTN